MLKRALSFLKGCQHTCNSSGVAVHVSMGGDNHLPVGDTSAFCLQLYKNTGNMKQITSL